MSCTGTDYRSPEQIKSPNPRPLARRGGPSARPSRSSAACKPRFCGTRRPCRRPSSLCCRWSLCSRRSASTPPPGGLPPGTHLHKVLFNTQNIWLVKSSKWNGFGHLIDSPAQDAADTNVNMLFWKGIWSKVLWYLIYSLLIWTRNNNTLLRVHIHREKCHL